MSVAFSLRRQHQAGTDRRAVDDNGARSAHTVLTAHMRPRELKMVAQRIGKIRARLDVNLDWLAIDIKAAGPGHHHPASDGFRPAAFIKARSSKTPIKARR